MTMRTFLPLFGCVGCMSIIRKEKFAEMRLRLCRCTSGLRREMSSVPPLEKILEPWSCILIMPARHAEILA